MEQDMAQQNDAYPWLEDPSDDPARLNWLAAVFNPLGETSRLHFTRIWTGLFFTRLIVFIAPLAVTVLLTLSGANETGFSAIPVWGFPLFVVVTGLMSYVLHSRRLTNAKRNPIWALLVILPLMFAGGGFVLGALSGGHDYDVAIEADQLKEAGVNPKQMAIDFERQEVYKTLSSDVMLRLFVARSDTNSAGAAVDLAIEDTQQTALVDAQLAEIGVSLNPDQRARLTTGLDELSRQLTSSFRFSAFLTSTRGSSLRDYRNSIENLWDQHLPDIDYETISQREHAIQSAIGAFIVFWILPSFFVMLWSLFWVGRLPNGGGRIKDRADKLRIDRGIS